MAKRPLTRDQQFAYDRATTLDKKYRQVKFDARAEVEKLVAERIEAAQLERDLAVRAAYDLGVPKARFRVREAGLHTTNQYDIDKVLERTESVSQMLAETKEEMAPHQVQYELTTTDNGQPAIRVTPPEDERAAMIKRQGTTIPDAEIPASGVFTVNAHGLLTSTTGSEIPGRFGQLDPVTAWVYQKEHNDEAAAWFREQTASSEEKAA